MSLLNRRISRAYVLNVFTRYRDHLSFRFLGVRYAPQPERYTDSVPYIGAGDQVSATEFGSECIQSAYGFAGSEDCLFLNIWTPYLPGPNSPKEKLRPVMVRTGSYLPYISKEIPN